MDTILTHVGSLLKKARLLKNISQADFAKSLGVSVRVVRKLEAGENVHLETFLKTVYALGYKDDLLIVLARPKPQTIEEHQDLILGRAKKRQRSR